MLALVGGMVTITLGSNESDRGSIGAPVLDIGTSLETAAEVCGISGVICDEGHTMTLSQVAAKEDPGPVSYSEYECREPVADESQLSRNAARTLHQAPIRIPRDSSAPARHGRRIRTAEGSASRDVGGSVAGKGAGAPIREEPHGEHRPS